MFMSLWRRLWNRNPVLPERKCPRGGRHLSYRPGLEPLEGRELPAFLGSAFFAIAPMPAALGVPLQTQNQFPGGTTPIRVTVAQNAPETVLDMAPVFAAMQGIQHQPGLRFSILGNSNSGLVRTDLSGTALTLTYTRGQCGTATITVNATDADRVSVRQTVVVTVLPLSQAGPVGVPPVPVPPQMGMPTMGPPVPSQASPSVPVPQQMARPLGTS